MCSTVMDWFGFEFGNRITEVYIKIGFNVDYFRTERVCNCRTGDYVWRVSDENRTCGRCVGAYDSLHRYFAAKWSKKVLLETNFFLPLSRQWSWWIYVVGRFSSKKRGQLQTDNDFSFLFYTDTYLYISKRFQNNSESRWTCQWYVKRISVCS